jgi:hypothetical protein
LFTGGSLKPFIDGILLKLKEYYFKEVESKPIYVAATILDPRLKLQYIKERYTDWKILKNTFLSNLEVYDTYGEVTYNIYYHLINFFKYLTVIFI